MTTSTGTLKQNDTGIASKSKQPAQALVTPAVTNNDLIIIQPKLTIGDPGDMYEKEANWVADRVMTMPEQNFVQRKCAACKDKEQGIQRAVSNVTPFAQTKRTGPSEAGDKVSSAIESSRGSGNKLDGGTRSFMEERFSADFSNVNIHTGNDAVQMSRDLSAQAFTVGSDIYFNSGKYSPGSPTGNHLLAHELTHVLQQSKSQNNQMLNQKSGTVKPDISRFTDTTHHIIEEAALAGGGFTEEQIKLIESGNIKRDYSQLPKLGNALLLCNANNFGGYDAANHFDNYIWNKEKNEWQDRNLVDAKRAGLAQPGTRGSDPIKYIMDELTQFVRSGLTKNGLERLGNAFHAIEDFFAHTNFVELINKDFRYGQDLLSGSVPGSSTVSVSHIFQDVSSRDSAAYYHTVADESKKESSMTSHANIAKDHPTDRNHFQARRLAALVVQDLSRDLLTLFKSPESERIQLLESLVFTKIRRYLRMPDSSKDPWWTELISTDNGVIDQLLEKAERKTSAMVNQCIFSPLRNLEASRDSNMKLILGAAMPVKLFGGVNFIQIGGGMVTPLNLRGATITSDKNDKPSWFVGGQVTGRF